MSSLREQLKRNKTVRGRRWVVKRDNDQNIIEVKMIYNPDEYITYKKAKPMMGDMHLLKILEREHLKNLQCTKKI